MSEIVAPEIIEYIVGVRRHPEKHYGRAVSDEETCYILHSQECKDGGIDLRACPFSIALDRGISRNRWADFQDMPVELWISMGRLVPIRKADPMNVFDSR